MRISKRKRRQRSYLLIASAVDDDEPLLWPLESSHWGGDIKTLQMLNNSIFMSFNWSESTCCWLWLMWRPFQVSPESWAYVLVPSIHWRRFTIISRSSITESASRGWLAMEEYSWARVWGLKCAFLNLPESLTGSSYCNGRSSKWCQGC